MQNGSPLYSPLGPVRAPVIPAPRSNAMPGPGAWGTFDAPGTRNLAGQRFRLVIDDGKLWNGSERRLGSRPRARALAVLAARRPVTGPPASVIQLLYTAKLPAGEPAFPGKLPVMAVRQLELPGHRRLVRRANLATATVTVTVTRLLT